ncbi:MAG: TldD/PmbA family protein [Myxococcota bacterium]
MINGHDEAFALGERVIEAAKKLGATVAEATVRESSHLSTKIRMDKPELVEEAGSKGLGLRVFIDQQVAMSYTSDLSDQGIQNLVEDVVELARLSQADEFAGPPDASLLSTEDQHQDLDLYDEGMGRLEADAALEMARSGEKAAFAHDERIINSEGATVTRVAGSSVLVTSGGFRGGSQGTYASVVVRPVVDDEGGKKRSGAHWDARRHFGDLANPSDVGKEAAVRTLRKLGAKKVATQEVPVVFDPDAARSILGLLAASINGSSIWRKSSYLAEREGTDIASGLVTIVDDPTIVRAPGSRTFDGEGLLARKNLIVEGGVLRTFLLDSYCARKLNKGSTASASRGGSGGVGPSTSNFILQPGSDDPKDIVSGTKAGLYVTEMMGSGFNPTTGDFSRGASGFWIENGELAYPVSEVTISLNLDEIWKRVDAVGTDLELKTSVAAPTFRVSSMTVAGR